MMTMENSSQCLINIDKTNYSQSLSIQIDDPNNNEHCDFKTNLQSDNNLLLVNDLSKTSVIVEHSSFSNSTLTRRPILTDRENFFADNPTVLLNGNQSQFKPNEPLPTHPRIAFRRISAPPKLLSERQRNNTDMANNISFMELPTTTPFINTDLSFNPLTSSFKSIQNLNETNKLAEMLFRQKLHQQFVDNNLIFNPKRRHSEPVNVKSKNKDAQIHFLWEFLLYLLSDPKYSAYIHWLNPQKRVFKIIDSKVVANLWGLYKGKSSMNYETMARALRYYYQKNLLRKINGRLVYQFVDLPQKSNFSLPT